jgi:hypothetical protein
MTRRKHPPPPRTQHRPIPIPRHPFTTPRPLPLAEGMVVHRMLAILKLFVQLRGIVPRRTRIRRDTVGRAGRGAMSAVRARAGIDLDRG